jgi:hypothetical protein
MVFASIFLALPASADEPVADATTPGTICAEDTPGDNLLLLEKPSVLDDAVSETWVLRDRYEKMNCRLPCAVRAGPWSGYVIEGVATVETSSSARVRHAVDGLATSTERFPLPDDLGGPPGRSLLVRVQPGKGSPDGAIGQGVASGVLVLIGAGLLAPVFTASACTSSCACDPFWFIALGVGGLGVTLGGVALVWGLASDRPKLVFSPAVERASTPAKPPPLRISLSPGGLVGSF